MEGKRFDQLARALATSSSRRLVLAGLLAGALGSLRVRTTAAQDDGIVIADASGGDDDLATVVEPTTGGSNGGGDGNNGETDKDQDKEHGRDNCDPETCPADQSTNSTGSGFCCDDGFCSCGGDCCGGPDCWIFQPDRGDQDPVLIETCTRPAVGCLECANSGGKCCADCTKSGDCVNPCIKCPGKPSKGVCCAACNDTNTKCAEFPDNTPISGGTIRRR